MNINLALVGQQLIAKYGPPPQCWLKKTNSQQPYLAFFTLANSNIFGKGFQRTRGQSDLQRDTGSDLTRSEWSHQASVIQSRTYVTSVHAKYTPLDPVLAACRIEPRSVLNKRREVTRESMQQCLIDKN